MKLWHHLRSPGLLPALIWKNIKFPFTRQGAERRYDRRLGLDTAGFVAPSVLGVGENSGGRGRAYEGTPPGIADFLIGQAASRARGFTFLDVGSGKGRVLLIASRFPFSRIVGFEYSEHLNEIAARNARQFAKHHPDMVPLELLSGDATRQPLPDGPLVIFLFNPFGPEAMRDFAACVKASYQQNPRKIICIYYNATLADEFDRLGIFPIQNRVETPPDPTDRYADLQLPTIVFETADSYDPSQAGFPPILEAKKRPSQG